MITADDKRRCLQREIKMRKQAYPRFVEKGQMTRSQADREIAVMEAILADYADPELAAVAA
jgi:hypothetical protein